MNPVKDESGISDLALHIFQWVSINGLCQIINIFGIVTNIINIICFAKQGFEDSINITLTALAMSDLGNLITSLVICALTTPAILEGDFPFDPQDVLFLTLAMPHLSFTRVSSCITAMVTLERCLCIIYPLKVKRLITSKRMTVITVCVFILFLHSGAPVFAVNRLDMKRSPLRNKTIIGIVSTKDRENVEMITVIINNLLLPFGAFMIIVVCTVLLSYKLNIQSKWRKGTITNSQIDRISSRNQKVGKMVVMISALFIACFIPVNANFIAAISIPDLLMNGKYVKLTMIISGIGFIMESINSSMNIFIYYHMSSIYRTNFLNLFTESGHPNKKHI